jgi:hypothetical protein
MMYNIAALICALLSGYALLWLNDTGLAIIGMIVWMGLTLSGQLDKIERKMR